jgi:hypothetical protein
MTTYYVKNGGSDAASGLSDALAWESVYQVNTFSFSPGDSVLFKCGGVWSENSGLNIPSSGSVGSPIIFGSYDTGAKPVINGRYRIPNGSQTSGSWTDYTGTVASTWYMVLAEDPGRLAIDGVEYWPALTYDAVNTTNRWFYGTVAGTAGRLLVYSPTGNPYNQLVMTQANSWTGLYVTGQSYVTLQNLEFRGDFVYVAPSDSASADCVTFDGCTIGHMSRGFYITNDAYPAYTCDYLIIKNCVIDSKASLANVVPYAPGVANHAGIDGIRIYGGNYFSIHDNTITDWFHSGINLTNIAETTTVSNGEIYNNTITAPSVAYCRGLEMDGAADGDCAYNIVHHNIIRNLGIANQLNGDNNEFYLNIIDGVTQPPVYPDFENSAGISIQGYDGPCHDNNYHHNLIRQCTGAGIVVISDATTNKYDNIFDSNVIYDCGFDNYYYGGDAAIRIQGGDDILNNTYTNNRIVHPTATDVVSYRGTAHTVADFNAHNGDASPHDNDPTQDDVISGNTLATALLCPFKVA